MIKGPMLQFVGRSIRRGVVDNDDGEVGVSTEVKAFEALDGVSPSAVVHQNDSNVSAAQVFHGMIGLKLAFQQLTGDNRVILAERIEQACLNRIDLIGATGKQSTISAPP